MHGSFLHLPFHAVRFWGHDCHRLAHFVSVYLAIAAVPKAEHGTKTSYIDNRNEKTPCNSSHCLRRLENSHLRKYGELPTGTLARLGIPTFPLT